MKVGLSVSLAGPYTIVNHHSSGVPVTTLLILAKTEKLSEERLDTDQAEDHQARRILPLVCSAGKQK
jgi:hypothetical protein